tara:strand:+ start:934 stop:1158 length:225 start_codon:yes stop_codon:yes gene_type:complete
MLKAEQTIRKRTMENDANKEPELEPMVMSVPEAGKDLGLGTSSSYAAAQRGEIPTIRIGRKLLVPIKKFRLMFE